MFDKQIFASRLKELREKIGLNQNKCAKKLNISRGSISFYENGERLPDIETIYNMATFFNVSADYLIGLTDVKTIDTNIKAICKYTGLSESAIKVLNEKKFKIETLKKRENEFYTAFDEKYKSIEEQKSVLTKEEYDVLFAEELKKLANSRGDSLDMVGELADNEAVITFLERLINSSLLEEFSIISNFAVFYQAKELKIKRFNDFMDTGYCKLSNELEEFKKARKDKLVLENHNDETDLRIYRGIKRYTRLIDEMAYSIAENGELYGSLYSDAIKDEENANN